MLRFYKGGISWTELQAMTLRQFIGLFSEIEQVMKVETGEKRDTPITGMDGAKAHAFMGQMYGGKNA